LNTIITDLGSNFTANQFWEFCENACIEVKYLSVAHPRANGQVERANGMIIDGLKKRFYGENSKKGGKWIHELPHVIWGLRTQPSKLSCRPTSCGNPQRLKCTMKARQMKLGSWNSTLSKRLTAPLLFSQLDTCRGSDDITIAT
jgi:transposase InsO family protein